MRYLSQKRWYLLMITGIFLLDRITKYIVLHCLQTRGYQFNRCIRFELALNRGISWGLLHFKQMTGFVVVSLGIAALMVILLWDTYRAYKRNIDIIGQLLMITGALSNMIDRIWYGGVIDFILLHYHDWAWPLFNIADVSIVCGALMLLVRLAKHETT